MTDAREQPYYAHPHALVETDAVGAGTRVWAFAHVMRGATVGRDCNVGDHSFIESGVTLGDSVVVKNGVSLWDGVTVEDGVFIGPNAAFTNDRVPRAKVRRDGWDRTTVRAGASIGANATILPGITIGRWALVGAGAVVTRDVPDHALVTGNPARVRGYVCRHGDRLTFTEGVAVCAGGLQYRQGADRAVEECG